MQSDDRNYKLDAQIYSLSDPLFNSIDYEVQRMVSDSTKTRAAAKKKITTGDSSDNDNRTLPAADIRAFLSAITGVITTAVTAATTSMRTAPYRSISTAINPFDTQSINFDTRGGKGQWYKCTEKTDEWKRIATVTANADLFTNLIKERTTMFEFGSLINVPTSGTGTVDPNPLRVLGVDVWSADLKEAIIILLQTHLVTLNHVQAYSGWIFGDDNSTVTKSADVIVKAIDPNKLGKVSLLNHEKICNMQFSSEKNFILKNHLKRISFISLNTEKAIFTYSDEVTGRKVNCGLVKLWLFLNIIKPQLVVNYSEQEKKLEALTLRACRNNVQKFLTTMETMKILINSMLPDKEEFFDQRFNTIMFDQLLKTS